MTDAFHDGKASKMDGGMRAYCPEKQMIVVVPAISLAMGCQVPKFRGIVRAIQWQKAVKQYSSSSQVSKVHYPPGEEPRG